jgi:hypothetical protein
MSTPYIASTILFAASAAIGSLPFIGGFRTLPRWIRLARSLVGVTFVTGGMLGFALYWASSRISYHLHQFLSFHIVLLVGMGLGIALLVLVSGEYFKALRVLDAARRERLAATARRSAADLKRANSPQDEPAVADLRRKWSRIRRADWSWGLRLNAKNTPPLEFLRDAPASKRPDFLPNATVIALAVSVRPHNTSDSDRRDRNPMATVRGRIIGWHKNRILTRRLS